MWIAASSSRASQTTLLRGATLWTQGPAGTLSDTDLLLQGGRIAHIGRGLAAPAGALEVDARGLHVTPGLIDAHSHIAVSRAINEFSDAITAEVRIADALDATDINLYRQLAGGVTTANVLHGSANAIGGQSQLIKLRWGRPAAELAFAGAPPSIKFALGENVKESNRSSPSTRYPQTRMGVEQLLIDAFAQAADYAAQDPRTRRRDLRPPSSMCWRATRWPARSPRWAPAPAPSRTGGASRRSRPTRWSATPGCWRRPAC